MWAILRDNIPNQCLGKIKNMNIKYEINRSSEANQVYNQIGGLELNKPNYLQELKLWFLFVNIHV